MNRRSIIKGDFLNRKLDLSDPDQMQFYLVGPMPFMSSATVQ